MKTLRSFCLPRFLTTFSARNANAIAVQDWTAVEESLQDYGPNGYHPVSIGDVLDSRYRVIRKLGWGVYSTVWLFQNESNSPPKYGALKVLTGLATNAPEIHELDYLHYMRTSSPSHPGYSHVIQLLNYFYHHGPNGRHLCLVTDAMAQDLSSFAGRWKNRRLPVSFVKQATRQVLLGLEYLHNCNIIHTDIKPSNILLVPPCDPALFFDQISSSRDAPGEMAIGRNNEGLPIFRARSQALLYPFPACDPNSKTAWEKTSVKLADVGVACWADKVPEHFTDLIQNPALRAPEVCIGSGWGKPADLWSLGCTIYELVMGQSMIKEDIIPESVPYIHTLRFGDYPLEMIKQGKYSKIFFSNEGSLRIALPQRSSLKSMVYSNGPPLNADAFIDFLQHMLMLDPKKRASCQELLAHEWLKR